jgi:hypothetical protein
MRIGSTARLLVLAPLLVAAGGCLPTVYNRRPEVRGTVRSTAGEPVRGATVRVSSADTPAPAGPAVGRSDAQGRFKVGGAPTLGFYWFCGKQEREWTWDVQAEAPGHTSASVELTHRGRMPRQKFDNLKFRLPAQ